jgi:hypothetical protein
MNLPEPIKISLRQRDQAIELLEEALHIRQNGENAPGGNENWRDWEYKTEGFLRSLIV